MKRGTTNGVPRPNGGGNFVYGFNSITNNGLNPGAVALFPNLANFNPTAALKGGSVRGAIQRGVSSGTTNFAPFLAIGVQGSSPPSVNNNAYILGISDAAPAHIVLRKGTIIGGVIDANPGTSGVLRRSTATIADGTWLHLRLDMVVNTNGDVILKVFENNLGSNPVTAPVWIAVAGMTDFTDDALGINSGTVPFTSGFFGFGFWMKDISRRGFVDHLEIIRQT